MRLHVAVVIVGFRNAGDIAACLQALEQSTHADFEVVVCENGGRAAFEALRRSVPERLAGGQPVRLVDAGANLGYGGGVNRGMAEAPDADAYWVLNPDTKPEPGALAACVARLAEGDCDAVGCTLYTPDGRVQAYGGQWQWLLGRAVAIGHGAETSAAVSAADVERRQSFISGAAALVSRRFLETVGPMREDYFLYCEEVEWFLRGRAKRMRLGFAPDGRILHDAGSTTGSHRAFRDMPKTPVYLNERNRILLTRDLSPALLPVVVLGALLVTVLRYARRGAWRQLGYAWAGLSAGVCNRRGPPAWIPIGDGS